MRKEHFKFSPKFSFFDSVVPAILTALLFVLCAVGQWMTLALLMFVTPVLELKPKFMKKPQKPLHFSKVSFRVICDAHMHSLLPIFSVQITGLNSLEQSQKGNKMTLGCV